MRIDWEQINRVVDSVRDRLYEIILPTERAFVVAKYNLEEVIRRVDKRKTMATRLWDQKFQGNRYVVLSEQQAHLTNDKPIDLNQGRKEKHSEREDFVRSLGDFMFNYNIRKAEIEAWREQQLNGGGEPIPEEDEEEEMKMVPFDTANPNFDENGENPQIAQAAANNPFIKPVANPFTNMSSQEFRPRPTTQLESTETTKRNPFQAK